MQEFENYRLLIFGFRHQQSVQNKDGHGEEDTPLTPEGERNAKNIARIAMRLSDRVDLLTTGTLKRHDKTTEILLKETGYDRETKEDPRLNAIFSGPILERPAEETVRTYNLERFNTGLGYYEAKVDGEPFLFDPEKELVYPFDPLYCHAMIDRKLRKAVFPEDQTLAPFDEINRRTWSFHLNMIERAAVSDKPSTVLSIGSCSPHGFILELARYGTIGENGLKPVGSDRRPCFFQDHDELMVLGYTNEDLEARRPTLRVVEGHVNAQKYLERIS